MATDYDAVEALLNVYFEEQDVTKVPEIDNRASTPRRTSSCYSHSIAGSILGRSRSTISSSGSNLYAVHEMELCIDKVWNDVRICGVSMDRQDKGGLKERTIDLSQYTLQLTLKAKSKIKKDIMLEAREKSTDLMKFCHLFTNITGSGVISKE